MNQFLAHLAAKTGDREGEWLPLHVHLSDTAMVTEYLIAHFLAEAIWTQPNIPVNELQKTAVFLAYVHDIGKATALFQSRITNGLPQCRSRLYADGALEPDTCFSSNATPHNLAGEVILKQFGCAESVAEIVGAHHGAPSDLQEVSYQAFDHAYPENYYGHDTEKQRARWHFVWEQMIAHALQKSDFTDLSEIPQLSVQEQILLTGILITADWIASNTAYFPLLADETCTEETDLRARAETGLRRLAFPEIWTSHHDCYSQALFRQSFSFLPYAVQAEFLRIVSACEKPGLFILEAPMGVGKSEAAIIGADILAAKTARNGVFFGLPSQATANGLFPRIEKWAAQQSENEYHSVRLVHGASAHNSLFASLPKGIPDRAFADDANGCGLIAHSWFAGSKQACLDQFVIGTVDRLLMMALKRRHIMLLHLGLSQKVVVIDECHAYDTYMNQYLEQALRWLGSYGTPVILLSATLPSRRRASLAAAYLRSRRTDPDVSAATAYPCLTWTDGDSVRTQALSSADLHQTAVHIAFLSEQELPQIIADAMKAGGCVGIILNTVRRAQAIAALLRGICADAEVILYHAQFIQSDRAAIEPQIISLAGKHSDPQTRRRTIIVGTQVLEQSLDIDFDLLITDICPMDLLLQRIGRLHRHNGRERPQPLKNAVCRILGTGAEFDAGTVGIYGEWLLKQTVAHLPAQIQLPADISPLVQAVYNAEDSSDAAYLEYLKEKKEKQQNAKAFLLGKPKGAMFSCLLDRSVSGNDTEAEASVRGGAAFLEVLVMMRTNDGYLHFLPHQENRQALNPMILPDDETCRRIAEQKLRLPSVFCRRYCIKSTLAELETQCGSVMRIWGMSPWLHGQLLLLLDETLSAAIGTFRLTYDRQTGLHYESEAKT